MVVKHSVVCSAAAAALACCAFASFGATSSETPGWEPTYKPGFDEMHTIAVFGDSISAGSQSHGDVCTAANYGESDQTGKNVVMSYAYWLAKMVPSNYNVINTSRPEMVTDSILAWQGGVDVRLNQAVTLPGNGSSVDCEMWFWDESAQKLVPGLNPDVRGGGMGLEVVSPACPGWINGVHVKCMNGTISLYAKAAKDVTLPAGAKFVPDFHYQYANSIQILFAGHNDGESKWQYNLEMLKKAVATIPDRRFIIVTSPCFKNADRYDAFVKEFGEDKYIDCYKLFNSDKGIASAIELGLMKQSELDHLEKQADGSYKVKDGSRKYTAWWTLLVEGTYAKPGPHMPAIGHLLLAREIHAKLVKNGWITTDSHAKHSYESVYNKVKRGSNAASTSEACGDGIIVKFCSKEGCREFTSEPSHDLCPGDHKWKDVGDGSYECSNWLCDETKSGTAHDHVYGVWTTNPAPTCVKSGTRTQSCTVKDCIAKKTETIAALGHDFKETSRTATQVDYKCSRCTATKTELLDHTHTYGAWTTNPPPTCVEGGLRTRTCTGEGCEEKIEEELPPTGHVWIETQRQAGEIHYECANCPEVYMEFYVEPEDPQEMGADWGWSNRVTVAGQDYCVLAFTNTAASGYAWTVPADVTRIDYLVVGGGGGGGGSAATSYYGGGGGGAGAVVSGTASVAAGDVLAALVGAGGAGGAKGAGTRGETGGDSSLTKGSAGLASAAGGGGGGASKSNVSGLSGACGGGGGVSKGAGGEGAFGGAGGKATDLSKNTRAGGGGGAGGSGSDGKNDGSGGEGGAGIASDITGASATYAQGGQGGGWIEKTTAYVAAKSGVDGTGNGGDGANDYYQCSCSAQADGLGGRGGNGIVIVRYAVSGGEEPPTHEHVWGEGSVTTEPTCVTPGVRTFHCSGCTETKTEQIAINPDNHLWATEPYKTEGGFDYYKCTRTGCTAEKQEKAEEPGPGPEPEPLGEDWGWSNRVTVAGTDYCVLAFTNTAASGFAWTVPTGVTAFRYLVVGGGGSGGSGGKVSSSTAGGGGGGAGGLREGEVASAPAGSAYVIRVGAGGLAPTEAAVDGGDGSDSSISQGSETVACARGGGGGGAGVYINAVTTEGRRGHDGGCGGGGGGCNTNDAVTAVMVPAGGAALDAEAGFGGGSGSLRSPGNNQSAGGGGGGAGAAGGKAAFNSPGAGGDGKVSDITGADVCYAGGGGGAFGKTGTKAGGAGGGGTGGATPTAGVDGLGAGGGGARGVGAGNGGSGIVIIRYAVPGEAPAPEEPEVVVPGEASKTYPDEAAAQAAAEKTKVGVPAAVAKKLNAAQQADYVKCFRIETRKTADNRWVNAAVLTEAAEAALQGQVDNGAVKVLSSLTDNALTLSPVTPGFYYALEYGETLEGMAKQSAQLATDADGLTLTLPNRSTSGFYRVIASERQ